MGQTPELDIHRYGAVTTGAPPATLREMSERGADPSLAVEVPASALSPRALLGLVDEFITREGTDYGVREHTLDEKRASLMRLIDAGEVAIFFDPESETTTLRSVKS
jgi:uncharacterized protein YheU (UPF0270 family)